MTHPEMERLKAEGLFTDYRWMGSAGYGGRYDPVWEVTVSGEVDYRRENRITTAVQAAIPNSSVKFKYA